MTTPAPTPTGRTRDAYLNRFAAYAVTVTGVAVALIALVWLVVRPVWWTTDCRSTTGWICDADGAIAAWLVTGIIYLGVHLPALGGGAAWTVVRTHPNWSRWRRTGVLGAVFLVPWTQLAVLSGVALALSELNAPGLVSGGLFVATLALPIIETAGFAVWRWRSRRESALSFSDSLKRRW